MDKKVHKAFYGKYNGIFCACANSVYQASPGGDWGGAWEPRLLIASFPGSPAKEPRNKAKQLPYFYTCQLDSMT